MRWADTAASIGEATQLLVGDVFVSSACIAYYGAFTGSYRDVLVGGWIERCQVRMPADALPFRSCVHRTGLGYGL